MTVILGVKCSDALVLASDSQATSTIGGQGIPVKLDASKVEKLGKYALFAGTGAQGCTQRVQQLLEPNAGKYGVTKTGTEIASSIHAEANKIQKLSAQAFVPHGQGAQPEAWGGIFCGWAKDGPWLMEIDLNGGWQFHDSFASTGSGHAFAHLALAHVNHFEIGNQTLEAAQAIAYRAIETTCLVSAFGVGLPVQLGVVTSDGARVLTEEEVKQTKELVNLWKAKEADSLGALVPKQVEEGGLEAAEGLEPPK